MVETWIKATWVRSLLSSEVERETSLDVWNEVVFETSGEVRRVVKDSLATLVREEVEQWKIS